MPQPPPVQRRHGPRADAAGSTSWRWASRTQGQIPRATARLALQRLVGTAERHGRWAVPPETLAPEERAATATSSVRRDGAGSSWTRRADPVEATMAIAWRCLRRAHGWSSGNTTLRRYCWTPTSGRCAASGRTMPGRKARRLACATTKRSCWSIPSAGFQHPVPAARGTSRTVALCLCPDLTAPPMRRETGDEAVDATHAAIDASQAAANTRSPSRRPAAQEAGQAVDAAVAEAAVAEAAADACGSGRRSHRLGQPPGDPDPDLRSRRPAAAEHTQAARLRDYSVTPVQPDKRLSAREGAAAAGDTIAERLRAAQRHPHRRRQDRDRPLVEPHRDL